MPCHCTGTHQKLTKLTGAQRAQSISKVKINFYFTSDL